MSFYRRGVSRDKEVGDRKDACIGLRTPGRCGCPWDPLAGFCVPALHLQLALSPRLPGTDLPAAATPGRSVPRRSPGSGSPVPRCPSQPAGILPCTCSRAPCSSLLPLSALSVSAPPASPAILILLTGPKDQTLRLSRACLSRLPTVPRFLFLLAAKPQPFPLAFSCNVLVNCVCLLRFFTRLVKCQSKFCVPLDTVQCGGDAEINTISLLGNSLDLEGSAAELCSGSVDLICWGTRLTLGARTALGAMGQLPAGWTRQRAAPRLHSWTRDPQDRDRRLSTSV